MRHRSSAKTNAYKRDFVAQNFVRCFCRTLSSGQPPDLLRRSPIAHLIKSRSEIRDYHPSSAEDWVLIEHAAFSARRSSAPPQGKCVLVCGSPKVASCLLASGCWLLAHSAAGSDAPFLSLTRLSEVSLTCRPKRDVESCCQSACPTMGHAIVRELEQRNGQGSVASPCKHSVFGGQVRSQCYCSGSNLLGHRNGCLITLRTEDLASINCHDVLSVSRFCQASAAYDET